MDAGQVDTITKLADAFKASGPFFLTVALGVIAVWLMKGAFEAYKDRRTTGWRIGQLGFAAVLLTASFVLGWRAVDWWLEAQDVPFGRFATVVRVPNDVVVWSDATYLYQQKLEAQRSPTHSIRLAFLFKPQCPDNDVLVLQMNREGMKKPDTFRLNCKALDTQWQTRRTFDLDVDDNGTFVLKQINAPEGGPAKAQVRNSDRLSIISSALAGATLVIPSETKRNYEAVKDLAGITEAAQILQSPRVPPGAKIEALGRLQASSPALKEVVASDSLNRQLSEPLYATLLDLQRHSDRQLARKTQILLADLPLVQDMARLNGSPGGRKQFAAIIESMSQEDLARARQQAQADGHTALAAVLTQQLAMKRPGAPIPTYTKDGDRFFVKASWQNRDEKTVQCVGKAYHDHWGGASLQQQTDLVRSRSTRTVYYTKDWAREMLQMLRTCGAEASYVQGFAEAPEAPLKALK